MHVRNGRGNELESGDGPGHYTDCGVFSAAIRYRCECGMQGEDTGDCGWGWG